MRQRGLVLLVAGVLGVCGCGDGRESAEVVDAHPFVVGEVPERWVPVIAGRGTSEQMWGWDSFGTDEPFTVLAGPEGTTATVSVTGFAGYEGGLHQAASGYVWGNAMETEVEGAPAYYTPSVGERWADLVVQRADDLAVRASAPGASRDELLALERAAEPADDHGRAPDVDDPPPGWSVVGSVQADVVLALFAGVTLESVAVPGPPSAYVAAWAVENGSLSALSLPSDAVDLPALERDLQELSGRTVDVGGRPGVVVAWRPLWAEGPGTALTAVITHDEVGAVAMVMSSGEGRASEEELVAMVASIAPADEATWESFVVEQTGAVG